MTDTWLISDTHLGHEGILRFTNYKGEPMRVFDNVNHMDEVIIERWNSVVKPEHKIYHLGDVAMKPQLVKTISRCNGNKTLILGNHDSPEMSFYKGLFKHVYSTRRLDKYLLSHIPVHPDSLGKSTCNVHGHVHSNIIPGQYGPRYYNVSIEVLDDYTPIHFDELKKRIEKQLEGLDGTNI